ncbi:MAG: bifunctional glutamate N-acetyltransferase/amino-acid acetyltransferase ArgJ, partial [Oscillospiraceae bacterium]|nr:bifunctional glutamate N-acetyltransferase/amino-acid acetyltransferase ArgJ [Oscillospiraceae bacterium]
MQQVTGGVTAPVGFRAAGIHCGVKAGNGDKDLAMILSAQECSAAATYTMNRVKAAPIYVTMEHLENGSAWGVIVNSGNANACAPMGQENAKAMCEYAAEATGRDAADFVVASTGVIGQTLNIAAIKKGMPALADALSPDGADAAAGAIMTTDTVKKECAVTCDIGGKTVTIGAMAKGSGMIHPNMGTMLCFVTTDCAIMPEVLAEALHEVVPRTFNRVTVDGDTSTNDMCVVLANGMAGNEQIEWKDEKYSAFTAALRVVCETLARAIAADGEGASHLLTCRVHHARSEESAERLGMSVIGSPLVKAAMFGADANWGRVLCAMGYSKAPFRPEFVDVKFCSAAGEIS